MLNFEKFLNLKTNKMKWKSKMEELGFTNETISVGLKKKINTYYQLLDGLEEAKNELDNASEDDVKEATDVYNELKESLQNHDYKIVRGLELLNKNKDKYAEMTKRLSDKKSVPTTQTSIPTTQTSVPTTQTSIPATQTSIPTTQTSIPATQTSIPATQTTNVAIEKEKKKSDKSWLVLGGLVLIVTLGAVNLFKED